MKAVQVTLDDELLATLDADPEVISRGRSAVVRAALRSWLSARREDAIVSAYRDGYGRHPQGADDLAAWAEQGGA